jgi:hypothetical protein
MQRHHDKAGRADLSLSWWGTDGLRRSIRLKQDVTPVLGLYGRVTATTFPPDQIGKYHEFGLLSQTELCRG